MYGDGWSAALDRSVSEYEDLHRDVAALVVPRVGSLRATGLPVEPYALVDPTGTIMEPVAVFPAGSAGGRLARRDSAAARGGPVALVAFPVGRGGRAGPFDPGRSTGFLPLVPARRQARSRSVTAEFAVGCGESGTGRPAPSRRYAPPTIGHSETVLRHSTSSIGTGVRGRSSTRSRRSGRSRDRTRTTTRCGHSGGSGWGCIGRRYRNGCRGRSRTSGSTSGSTSGYPQGNPCRATTSGLGGRVRMVAALPA